MGFIEEIKDEDEGSGAWFLKAASKKKAEDDAAAAAAAAAAQHPGDPDRVGLHVGCTVKLHSLVAAPQHNGAEGELGGYDESAGRWEVNLSTGGAALRVKPANLTFIQAKRSFFFAPTRRKVSNSKGDKGKPVQASESEQLIRDAGAQSNSSVSEELLQEAFEQVIGELGPSLRTSLGFVEAKTVAEHAANDRVDAAVGETLEPLLNGIEAAAKTSASEAAFTSAVNKLVLDYFGKSSLGSRNTLSARRRDLDEQFQREHTAFSQIEEELRPKLRERLGFMPCAAHAEEHALNARIDSEIQTLLQPLLVVVEQAARSCASQQDFKETASKLVRAYFTDATSPGCATRLVELRRELDDRFQTGKNELQHKDSE